MISKYYIFTSEQPEETVSRVGSLPSSERLEELWVVVWVYAQKMELRYWWEYDKEKTRINWSNEKRSLIP